MKIQTLNKAKHPTNSYSDLYFDKNGQSYIVSMGIAVLYNVPSTIGNTLYRGKVQKSKLFITCVKS